MGITSFNAFCADSKPIAPDPRIVELRKIFPVIIIIVGSVGVAGNVLNLFTLKSPSLQTVPFRYIRALALFDLIGLTAILLHCIFYYTGAVTFLPIAYYSIYVEDLLINSFLVAGLYCAVLLTVERFLLIRNPHTKRTHISSVVCKIFGALLFSILLHLPMVLQVTAKTRPDGTLSKGNNKAFLCREPYWTIYSYYGFFRESLRFGCVFVLVALNIFIARQLQIAKKNRRLLKKHSSFSESGELLVKGEKNSLMKSFTEKRLTALMIAICFIYMIGNVPQTIVMIFQNESAEAQFSFQLFRYIANTFETLNHCLNFFIFCMASSEYTRAFLTACPCLQHRFEAIPFCARLIHSRRFTISELQSENRAVYLRKNSSLGSSRVQNNNNNKKMNRRNTSVTFQNTTQSTVLDVTPKSSNARRKSTPPLAAKAISTVCDQVKPEMDSCMIIENEVARKKRTSLIVGSDFQDGDVFL